MYEYQFITSKFGKSYSSIVVNKVSGYNKKCNTVYSLTKCSFSFSF